MPPPDPLRTAAKLAGERHYFAKKPCKHGHQPKRLTSTGICVQCGIEKNRKYHAERPGLMAKWAREARAVDPMGHRLASRKWAKNNRDKMREIQRRCIEKNMEYWLRKFATYNHNHRAKQAGDEGRLTIQDINAALTKQNGLCAACGDDGFLEIDHIIPTSRGGTNDATNLQMLCGFCNKQKGNRTPKEWADFQAKKQLAMLTGHW